MLCGVSRLVNLLRRPSINDQLQTGMVKMPKLLLLLVTTLSFALVGKEDILTLDRVVPHGLELSFPNDENIAPEISDFEVKNTILMSNENGERFAVVTIKNVSSGSRTLNHNHLMAQVTNGARINPQPFKHAFKGNETVSITIGFGESKFPLLTVYTRTK